MSAIPRNGDRFVIARRWTGLGDCIVSLSAAWAFAGATGRTLVVDWRGSAYLPDGNVFDRVFAPGPELAGVPLVSGDDLPDLVTGRRTWPSGWTVERLAHSPVVGERQDAGEGVALLEPRRRPRRNGGRGRRVPQRGHPATRSGFESSRHHSGRGRSSPIRHRRSSPTSWRRDRWSAYTSATATAATSRAMPSIGPNRPARCSTSSAWCSRFVRASSPPSAHPRGCCCARTAWRSNKRSGQRCPTSSRGRRPCPRPAPASCIADRTPRRPCRTRWSRCSCSPTATSWSATRQAASSPPGPNT